MKSLIAAAVALTFATSASALDLLGAYERALAHDPSQQAALEAQRAGREKRTQGNALLRPQLQLTNSASHLDNRSGADTAPPLSSISPARSSGVITESALQLKQPLYNAKSAAERRQLHEQAGLADVSYLNAQQDLLQRVAEAYLNVLLAEEQARVVAAERAAVGSQRDRAQARFEVGRARITDVQEAQARYDSVLAREIAVLSTLDLRRAQFEELTGAPATGLAALRADFVPAPPQPDELGTWQRRAYAGNVTVQARERELAIANAEIGKYRLSGRPSVDLVASWTHKGQSGELSPLVAPDNNRAGVIGVQVTIPLYAGGGLDSREREAMAKAREAEHQLAATRRDTRLRVRDAYLAVKTGVARVAALEQSVLSAASALEASTLGRDLGTRTEVDVLDAQQRLFTAQFDRAQARYDYLLGRIKLAAAAGELAPADLRRINDALVRAM